MEICGESRVQNAGKIVVREGHRSGSCPASLIGVEFHIESERTFGDIAQDYSSTDILRL